MGKGLAISGFPGNVNLRQGRATIRSEWDRAQFLYDRDYLDVGGCVPIARCRQS